jgi:hypothetical protein
LGLETALLTPENPGILIFHSFFNQVKKPICLKSSLLQWHPAGYVDKWAQEI